jgi:hypothetical protein
LGLSQAAFFSSIAWLKKNIKILGTGKQAAVCVVLVHVNLQAIRLIFCMIAEEY